MNRRNKIDRLRIVASIFLVVMLLLVAVIIAASSESEHKTLKTDEKTQTVLAEQDHSVLEQETRQDNTVSSREEEEKNNSVKQDAKQDMEQEDKKEDPRRLELMEQADRLVLSYDYDGAIALLTSIQDYDGDEEIQGKLKEIESIQASCMPVNMDEIVHVFYHSLVVDPKRAFANQDTDSQAKGNNQWMTTVSEFEKIIREMYDRGYVIVGLHDLMETVKDAEGNTVYEPAQIMLPQGKKAYVLSQDDLSYYHCYDNYGYAAKIVLDENDKPICEYIQEDGTIVTGAYDVVPLLDAFIEEHPDASYRGAKGIIALTGYNGILGYRTDISYTNVDTPNLYQDKKDWILEHPDFDIEKEREEAKKVADAMKADGWEFASHTWGHIRIAEESLERLISDTQKWRENVEPLVGPVDTIIFAHGQDLGDWGPYSSYDEKYQYLRGEGYRIFCNVDSNLCRNYLGRDYLRQGRVNLDGLMIYGNMTGERNNLADLFDAAEVIDPLRPPVLPLR